MGDRKCTIYFTGKIRSSENIPLKCDTSSLALTHLHLHSPSASAPQTIWSPGIGNNVAHLWRETPWAKERLCTQEIPLLWKDPSWRTAIQGGLGHVATLTVWSVTPWMPSENTHLTPMLFQSLMLHASLLPLSALCLPQEKNNILNCPFMQSLLNFRIQCL